MYKYHDYSYKKRKKWPFLVFTFIVAVSGSYLVQTFLSVMQGNEIKENRLRNEVSSFNQPVQNNRAEIIEDTMESVV